MNSRIFSHHCCVFAVLAIYAICSEAPASDFRQCEVFAPVVKQAKRYASRFGGKNVLAVMDIDNTLLAMDRDLGSDQWFEWQEYLLENEPNSAHLVASDMPGLLRVQGLLFASTTMHPPEPDQPSHVAAIQDLEVDTVVLTSRGDDFRPSTQRELQRAGYNIAKSAPSISLFQRSGNGPQVTCSRFLPYKYESPTRPFGLMPRELELFDLSKKPREVSYGDGVMMTAGQHKGAMLLVLLHLIEKQYSAIVFVDDHGRHVSRVYDALVRRGIEVTTFHYTHEDSRVERFAYGDKGQVTREWRRIERVLARPKRNESQNGKSIPRSP